MLKVFWFVLIILIFECQNKQTYLLIKTSKHENKIKLQRNFLQQISCITSNNINYHIINHFLTFKQTNNHENNKRKF